MKATILTSVLLAAAVSGFAQTPVIDAGGVVNGASFTKGQAVAPGALVSLFGTSFANGTSTASSVPLSTSLGNVSVTFNGTAAPLTFVNGTQINAQMPWEVAGQASVQAVITAPGGKSAAQTVSITSAAPGLFNFAFGGSTYAIAYTTVVLPNGQGAALFAVADGAIPGLQTLPAKINDPSTLVLLATGLGPVTPPLVTGHAVDDGQLHRTNTLPVVLVGNVPAQVVFSGASPQFVGVYQMNIIIAPGTPTGNNVPLQIQMGNITTSNQITIAVSN